MNYTKFLERILETLQNNKDFADKISEFRFGDMGDYRDKILHAESYPLCFVTTATNPEVSRTMFAPASDVNKLPGQKIILEFWVIIVTGEATPQDTQNTLYGLTDMTLNILSNNVQLRDANDSDPLCSTSDVMTQRRLETSRGKLLEAMTVRIRPVLFTS